MAGSFESPDGAYRASWALVAGATPPAIDITMEAQTSGWVAIGFSSGPQGHQMTSSHIAWVDPNASQTTFFDAISNQRRQPNSNTATAASDIIGSEVNGITRIKFRRPLRTNTPEGPALDGGPIFLVWAFGAVDGASPMQFPQHALRTRGFAPVDFLAVDGGGGTLFAIRDAGTGLSATILVAFIAVAIIKVARRLVKRIYELRRRAAFRGFMGPRGFIDSNNSEATGFEVFIHAPKPITTRLRNTFVRWSRARLFRTQITLRTLIIWGAYVAVNLGWVYVWPSRQWDTAVSLGNITAANMFPVLVVATRNSPVSWFLNIPFDRAVSCHRWLGMWITFLAALHGVYELIGPRFAGAGNGDPNVTILVIVADMKSASGLIAFAPLIFMVFTSITWIRRNLFNVFFYCHFAFIAFYVLAFLHSPFGTRIYVIAAAFAYIIDHLARRLMRNRLPFPATDVKKLPGDVVRLRFPRAGPMVRYRAGQYVFVNFPAVKRFEWHPYSLSSGPYDDLCEIHIKVLGDTTEALVKWIIEQQSRRVAPLMRVEGPYGHLSPRYNRYSTVLLIGGGIGITPLISIVKDLYQLDMSAAARAKHARSALVQHCYLVWSVPTELEWAWFAETLEKARGLARQPTYPLLTVFGHITKQKTTKDAMLRTGRPNLQQIFEGIEGDMIGSEQANVDPTHLLPPFTREPSGRVSVFACGPQSVVNQASDYSQNRTRGNFRYDFHKEIFEF